MSLNTKPEDTITLKGLITETIIFGAKKPTPAPPKKEYRYYHCRAEGTELKCKKVISADIKPSEENTQLLTVKSYIPEHLDSQILKYKWTPSSVYIDDKSA